MFVVYPICWVGADSFLRGAGSLLAAIEVCDEAFDDLGELY